MQPESTPKNSGRESGEDYGTIPGGRYLATTRSVLSRSGCLNCVPIAGIRIGNW
jgi:hypothetical protein